MIQQETVLKIADNCGVKTVKCVKVLGGFKRKYAYLGDIIVVSIQNVRLSSSIKKGEVFRAVIVQTKQKIKNKDGSSILLFSNQVCLISKKVVSKRFRTINPVATRIYKGIPKSLTKKFLEFVKISSGIF
jgi:large subunit ribosomal protein L14